MPMLLSCVTAMLRPCQLLCLALRLASVVALQASETKEDWKFVNIIMQVVAHCLQLEISTVHATWTHCENWECYSGTSLLRTPCITNSRFSEPKLRISKFCGQKSPYSELTDRAYRTPFWPESAIKGSYLYVKWAKRSAEMANFGA